MDDLIAAQCLAALGHQDRLAILQMLVRSHPQKFSVAEIGQIFGLKGANLTYHLTLLRQASLCLASKEGRQVFHVANCQRIAELLLYLQATTHCQLSA